MLSDSYGVRSKWAWNALTDSPAARAGATADWGHPSVCVVYVKNVLQSSRGVGQRERGRAVRVLTCCHVAKRERVSTWSELCEKSEGLTGRVWSVC